MKSAGFKKGFKKGFLLTKYKIFSSLKVPKSSIFQNINNYFREGFFLFFEPGSKSVLGSSMIKEVHIIVLLVGIIEVK